MLIRASFLALIAALTFAAPAVGMSFDIMPLKISNCTNNCPEAIVAAGPIGFDDIGTLVSVVVAHKRTGRKDPTFALLSSAGGNVGGSRGLGELFRKLNLTVIVGEARANGPAYSISPGACHGSCIFALVGGVRRFVPQGSEVSLQWISGPVPQVSSGSVFFPDPANAQAEDQQEQNMRRYMARMGVKADLIAVMKKVPSGSARTLTQKEIAQFGLARAGLQ